jgi:hypothetical protein
LIGFREVWKVENFNISPEV